ncbi:MAG: carbohydrate kinase [Treponema sp.]|jgi:fructokinase|nr:carbohydrate kinase [Treponema sp.]
MILCCGEALIDMVPERDSAGRNLYAPCYGGSPYNTAIAAGRVLGRDADSRPRTAFFSRLSTDFFGEELIRNLEANYVSTALVRRTKDETTTLAFVKLEAEKEPSYLFYTTGAADRALCETDLPEKLPAEVNCLLFGSISMTLEPAATAIESLIMREHAREGGPVISHDPNVRPLMILNREAWLRRFENWARASDIVKISAADFDFIYPRLGLEACVEKLLSLGPRLVAVTLGKDGALALLKSGGGIIRVRAAAVDLPVADTIGAGDTFHGAFLAKLELEGRLSREALPRLDEAELKEALIFANRAAAIVCSRKGANPPALSEIKAF